MSYSPGYCSFNDTLGNEGLNYRKPLLKRNVESCDEVSNKNFRKLDLLQSKIIPIDTDLSPISQKYFFFA